MRRQNQVPFHNRTHRNFLLIACVETPHSDEHAGLSASRPHPPCSLGLENDDDDDDTIHNDTTILPAAKRQKTSKLNEKLGMLSWSVRRGTMCAVGVRGTTLACGETEPAEGGSPACSSTSTDSRFWSCLIVVDLGGGAVSPLGRGIIIHSTTVSHNVMQCEVK